MELKQFFYFLDVLFVSYVQRFYTSVEFPNLSGERPNETDKHDYLMPVAPNYFVHVAKLVTPQHTNFTNT